MQINYPMTYYNYNQTPNFKSSMRGYRNAVPNVYTGQNIYTTTCLFRGDLSFTKLVDFVIKHFENKDKVNVMCLAGSDGSEAYSLAIPFLEKLPKNQLSKFLPIISNDKDKEITDFAKSGKINLSELDFASLKKNSITHNKYFTSPQKLIPIPNDTTNPELYKTYDVSQKLQETVKFSQGDLLKILENVKDDGNSVVLCRNIIPYLQPYQISNIAYAAKNNLKKGSLFVIGKFDEQSPIRKYLLYEGFSEIMERVFLHN